MDEEGVCVFYDRTAHKLRAYLRSVLTDDVALVDDILQESYFRFLKADLPVDMDLAWRKNYLYRIATNMVRDHRRSGRWNAYRESQSTRYRKGHSKMPRTSKTRSAI